MLSLKAGIEDLKQAKTLMSEANHIMSDHVSKLKALEEENAELQAELDDWKGNAEGFQPDAYMKLPLDADGVPIHIGDAVCFENEVTKVYGMHWNGTSWSLSLHNRAEDTASHRCRRVPTASFVGADDAPIAVGDIVYRDDDPEPLKVVSFHGTNGSYCTVGLEDSDGILVSADAPRLSHEKPEPADSWEKLEEDAMQHACFYLGIDSENTSCEDCPHGSRLTGRICWQNARLDMIARAKKLAGIEEEAER
ncbi:hypothetical protein [uncultured Slackia sp.]|uniref:hypothetical protein n=1 Tax=uncultured Slackia sp. TaxID=665903 RepID=UPI0025EC671B|nr:hypothetical protein [uncultured Slackia sp.]